MTREELVKKLIDSGIDVEMAESLAKSAMKGNTAKKPDARRNLGQPRAKKYVGRLEVTDVCATCGTRTKRTLITEIDPKKPRSLEVVVSLCSACIPRYRAMTSEELIGLIILKDHPDIGFRMLSNKAQIRLAKTKTPEWLFTARLELDPAEDDRFIRPQYDKKPELVDEALLKQCQAIYDRAVKELGEDLGGQTLLSLLALKSGAEVENIKLVLPLINRY